jgi:hypothetical protein
MEIALRPQRRQTFSAVREWLKTWSNSGIVLRRSGNNDLLAFLKA